VDQGEVEEVWYSSSHDGLSIQGWIVKPPEFDTNRKYPLILEIHGGPFSNYGDRFAAEYQLYAAAGFVVLYTNPRGSTSYGQDFGNAIHHAYPGNDYYDLMSGVDELISRGYIDEKQLFVTGASGGGVLSSWIVGHTDRFAGAAVQKPVVNWYSWVLTADMGGTGGLNYWLPDAPWNALEHYMQRSPIHHVGNVVTPTMLITGEVDWRTPMSESEQFYQALKIQKIPAMLVRIPEGNHGFESRPSHLISKVQHILAWFNRYRN
jgi:acylaminoacyl-peptidase